MLVSFCFKAASNLDTSTLAAKLLSLLRSALSSREELYSGDDLVSILKFILIKLKT